MENIIKVIDRLMSAKIHQAKQYTIIKGKFIDTGHKFPVSISVSELLTTDLYRQDVRIIFKGLEELGYISDIMVLGYNLDWKSAILRSTEINYRFQLTLNKKKLEFYKHQLINDMADWRFKITISDNGSIYRSDNRNLSYTIKQLKAEKPKRFQSPSDGWMEAREASRDGCLSDISASNKLQPDLRTG